MQNYISGYNVIKKVFMRVLLVSFLTFVAIHSSAFLINAQESSFLYVQLVAADFGEEHHDNYQLNYRAFKSQDDCENNLLKELKNEYFFDIKGGKAEYVRERLVIKNAGGFVKIRCVEINTRLFSQ